MSKTSEPVALRTSKDSSINSDRRWSAASTSSTIINRIPKSNWRSISTFSASDKPASRTPSNSSSGIRIARPSELRERSGGSSDRSGEEVSYTTSIRSCATSPWVGLTVNTEERSPDDEQNWEMYGIEEFGSSDSASSISSTSAASRLRYAGQRVRSVGSQSSVRMDERLDTASRRIAEGYADGEIEDLGQSNYGMWGGFTLTEEVNDGVGHAIWYTPWGDASLQDAHLREYETGLSVTREYVGDNYIQREDEWDCRSDHVDVTTSYTYPPTNTKKNPPHTMYHEYRQPQHGIKENMLLNPRRKGHRSERESVDDNLPSAASTIAVLATFSFGFLVLVWSTWVLKGWLKWVVGTIAVLVAWLGWTICTAATKEANTPKRRGNEKQTGSRPGTPHSSTSTERKPRMETEQSLLIPLSFALLALFASMRIIPVLFGYLFYITQMLPPALSRVVIISTLTSSIVAVFLLGILSVTVLCWDISTLLHTGIKNALGFFSNAMQKGANTLYHELGAIRGKGNVVAKERVETKDTRPAGMTDEEYYAILDAGKWSLEESKGRSGSILIETQKPALEDAGNIRGNGFSFRSDSVASRITINRPSSNFYMEGL
ncbi:hypothetical protein BJ742DRAFT_852037 [Cladochytrium replicatum]|nr:hypothetical protein BJ742DRAFT_852037 [Cladochytrium replicatum]